MNFNFKCKLLDDEKEMKTKETVMLYVRTFIVEFIGTFLLMHYGCSCSENSPPASYVAPLCWGMVLMSILQVIGPITLCHINPAISLSFWLLGLHSLPIMFLYMVAQILGSTVGTVLAKEMLTYEVFGITKNMSSKFCVAKPVEGLSFIKCFFWEFGLTCYLILFVCSLVDPRNATRLDSMPIKFGFLLFVIIVVGAPMSGATVNPARVIGPALIAGDFANFLVYMTAPMIASAVTTAVYHILVLPKNGEEPFINAFKGSKKKQEEEE